eukprot:scaffold281538_cov36-Tisochrysis_lutea.AAC.2
MKSCVRPPASVEKTRRAEPSGRSHATMLMPQSIANAVKMTKAQITCSPRRSTMCKRSKEATEAVMRRCSW